MPATTPNFLARPSGFRRSRPLGCFAHLANRRHHGVVAQSLEGAYTPEEYRGQGIMTGAMAQIAERGRVLEARWVITFVDEGNAASLKGCERAGFTPYVRRREAFRLFVRRVAFTPLAAVPTERTGAV